LRDDDYNNMTKTGINLILK